MNSLLNEIAKVAIVWVLGLVYLWFFMSFVFSFSEMSVAEMAAGVTYALCTVPLYEKLKNIFGLQ